MNRGSSYDERYARDEYYWGKTPSAVCAKIVELMQPSQDSHLRLIDLGCGEGRNAIYFAKHGFEVVALDISQVGLNKVKRFANEEKVRIKTIEADIISYELHETYDVVFSTGTLHYLAPEIRAEHFRNYKDHTSENGINAFSVFVKKPFIPKAPDTAGIEYSYESGELMSYYWDWEILQGGEEIFDCMSSGVPHKHAVSRIIARRYHVP